MNPNPPPMQPPAPTQPYTLPTVALISSVVGLCLCPFALLGGVLGLIALLRISKEPWLQGKTLAIIALVIPGLAVPTTGMLAAIAIPNFIKYQARAKQSECKFTLKHLQRELMMNGMGAHWSDLEFKPEPGNRYSYFLSPTDVYPADTRKFPSIEREDHVGALVRAGVHPGVTGTCPQCNVTIACVGNIDNDDVLDIWSISTEDRIGKLGGTIPACEAYNDVNDVTTP